MAILGYKNTTLFIREYGLAGLLKERGLAGWIEIATDHLEPAAKQRIAEEIQAHYAEAVHDHLEAGECERAAETTAFLELGDAEAAAASFRKSHLTESEAKLIRTMEWGATKPLCSFWTVPLDVVPILGIVVLFAYPLRNFCPDLLAFVFLTAYFGFRLIPRFLFVQRLPRNSFVKKLTLCTFFASVAIGACTAVIFYGINHNYMDAFLGAYFCIWLNLGPASPLRIWNKLHKMADREINCPRPL